MSIRPLIERRARMLRTVRTFFEERAILEVDCPILSKSASVDTHIDLIPALYDRKQRCYLHSSPEYGMKRLLADGSGDIYQLSHVFRDGECGRLHNPEFMLIEWYRIGFSFEEMIEETIALCQLFLGKLPFQTISYREAFLRYVGIDPFHASLETLQQLAFIKSEDRETLLHAILAEKIEPQLQSLTALIHYPASQAALAKKRIIDGIQVAERFEIYYKGIELANGYHELQDPVEQRARFVSANQERKEWGKEELPLDEDFLSALEKGLPECSGVAVGFDRLLLLQAGGHRLSDHIYFGFMG